MDDEFYMAEALKEARKAFDKGEVPVGAIAVFKNRIIAKGYNQIETLRDATAHAEMIVITQASSYLENWRLNEVTIYVTKEPCPMCAGAMVNSRIKRLVYGAYDREIGSAGSVINLVRDNRLRHKIESVGGVKEDECRKLLQDFFRRQRIRDTVKEN